MQSACGDRLRLSQVFARRMAGRRSPSPTASECCSHGGRSGCFSPTDQALRA